MNRRRRQLQRAAGFTLMEAALATVIIGTGVLAILAAQQAYHQKNDWAQRTGTAQLLANEIRELTMFLPQHDPVSGASTIGVESNESGLADYDDLDDFAGVVDGVTGRGSGVTFNPPINALRQDIPNMAGWEQEVRVENVRPDNISVSSSLTQPLGTTELVRMTVTVRYTPPNQPKRTMTTLTWIVGPRH